MRTTVLLRGGLSSGRYELPGHRGRSRDAEGGLLAGAHRARPADSWKGASRAEAVW